MYNLDSNRFLHEFNPALFLTMIVSTMALLMRRQFVVAEKAGNTLRKGFISFAVANAEIICVRHYRRVFCLHLGRSLLCIRSSVCRESLCRRLFKVASKLLWFHSCIMYFLIKSWSILRHFPCASLNSTSSQTADLNSSAKRRCCQSQFKDAVY